MTSKIIYLGELRTESTHVQSGTKIQTDAPTDNHGKGEVFSPTDMVANSLGTCMITTMGIKANAMDITLDGTEAEVTKIMVADPRRIGEIKVSIRFPKMDISEKDKTILENTALTCPVAKSLSPELIQTVSFEWQ
ncbi:MAG: osmotically inducible protein OsmC [Pseudopedobacter saltans]|uniref:Osmotically inducible protein OsmC n=1 Tax=Pseudopedobacter saltans TaxID=151895 RepID=A0A2W5EPB2_9SPHI|nr:MAG: osmotically inducible protein OsmC [Pseudopedobacter saltans]